MFVIRRVDVNGFNFANYKILVNLLQYTTILVVYKVIVVIFLAKFCLILFYGTLVTIRLTRRVLCTKIPVCVSLRSCPTSVVSAPNRKLPLTPKTGRGKRYSQLPNFIRCDDFPFPSLYPIASFVIILCFRNLFRARRYFADQNSSGLAAFTKQQVLCAVL